MSQARSRPLPAPLLSVLVPTYNHAQGLRQIVASMGSAAHDQSIELLVHDDSTDDQAAREIEAIVAACGRGIYRRNQPSKGAVGNWNGLLDAAQGDYCLLMHHDEHFETPKTLQDAMAVLHGAGDFDGVVFPCRVVTAGYPHGRRHMPVWLARWIVNTCPGYMLRRNPLGAPSTLLLRRKLYPRYDNRLRWLVDCELYVRAIAANHPRLAFLSDAGIISSAAGTMSITASLGPSISRIRDEEITMLQKEGLPPARGAWLVSASPGAAVARAIETAGWMTFRSIQRMLQMAIRGR